MSLWLPQRTVGGIVSSAICDRCRKKTHYMDLQPDGDSPGLRVCDDCRDEGDPWRRPARREEKIGLQHPRPTDRLFLREEGEDEMLYAENEYVESEYVQ